MGIEDRREIAAQLLLGAGAQALQLAPRMAQRRRASRTISPATGILGQDVEAEDLRHRGSRCRWRGRWRCRRRPPSRCRICMARPPHQHSSSKRLAISVEHGLHGRLLVLSVGADDDPAPLPRRQQQDAQDALGVDLFAVLRHRDPALESARRVHQLRRRPRVQAQAVDDLRRRAQSSALRLRPPRTGCFARTVGPAPARPPGRRSAAPWPAASGRPRRPCAARRPSGRPCAGPSAGSRRSGSRPFPAGRRSCAMLHGRAAEHVGEDQHPVAPGRAAPGRRRPCARASSNPSLQSSDRASKPLRRPEMTLAAASSSRARPPCVRTSLPIIEGCLAYLRRLAGSPRNNRCPRSKDCSAAVPAAPGAQRAMSRWITRAGQPCAPRARAFRRSATATDRCLPPVQPIAIDR